MASGVRDEAGIREFIVGTGGAALRGFTQVKPNSLVRIDGSHGVLALVLRPTSYSWDFVPLSGAVADTGTARCH
jgi:acid phosphatase type 7